MDESSPVYENFMNKMSAMGSGRPKINRTTFNIGANVLERRVANNSRKITIIKSILKNQKIDIGEKLTTPEPDKTSEVSKELASINSTLVSIGNILSTDFANRIAIEKGQSQLLKAEKQRRRRSLAESGIESVKKIGKGLGKITSPIREGGSNILKALSLLGLGVAGNIAFDFLKSDFGQEKIGEFFTFLKDNWKWMLGTIIGVGGALALGGLISGIKAIGLALAFLKSPLVLAALGIAFALALGYKFGKPAFDAKVEAADKSVKKLKEEGLDQGTAEILTNLGSIKDVDGKRVLEGYGPPTTTNIPGDIGGNAGVGMVFSGIDGNVYIPPTNINKKPKITEITLPIEKLTGRNKIVNPDLPTTTDVPYVTSINLENEYMKKTPKIHGIKL